MSDQEDEGKIRLRRHAICHWVLSAGGDGVCGALRKANPDAGWTAVDEPVVNCPECKDWLANRPASDERPEPENWPSHKALSRCTCPERHDSDAFRHRDGCPVRLAMPRNPPVPGALFQTPGLERAPHERGPVQMPPRPFKKHPEYEDELQDLTSRAATLASERKTEAAWEAAIEQHFNETKPSWWVMFPVWVSGWVLGLVTAVARGLWHNFWAGFRRVAVTRPDYHPDYNRDGRPRQEDD